MGIVMFGENVDVIGDGTKNRINISGTIRE